MDLNYLIWRSIIIPSVIVSIAQVRNISSVSFMMDASRALCSFELTPKSQKNISFGFLSEAGRTNFSNLSLGIILKYDGIALGDFADEIRMIFSTGISFPISKAIIPPKETPMSTGLCEVICGSNLAAYAAMDSLGSGVIQLT